MGLLVVACTSAPSPSPTTTSAPPAITAITAGGAHTCALTSGGGVKCWGNHGFGGTPGGAIAQSIVPVDIAGLASDVVSIGAGGAHTCAVTSGGDVECWGNNSFGQIGDGTTTEHGIPVRVPGLATGVSAVSAGHAYTCALTIGGGVKCWGYNYIGQLGDGTTTDSLAPIDVVGLASGVRAIAASQEHTCAVTIGGGVKCWGSNRFGQLGDGTIADSLAPVDVEGLVSGVTAIALGSWHTCALTSGGGVKCWGNGGLGQLGRMSPTGSSAPVDVAGLESGVITIAAGGSNTCVVTSGGQVKCWGENTAGQLGNGTTIDSRVPVDVVGFSSGTRSIAVGGPHTCALTSAGAVGCWGDNMYWQLGSRRACGLSSSLPVDVAFAPPSVTNGPTGTSAPIEHASGPTDVVLRFDIGPDLILPNQFSNDVFRPGPEFTLYGDGTAIFRNERADLPPAEGSITRARPFSLTKLDEDEVQSLLVFALGEGGLGDACARYEAPATDDSTASVFTIRAGGFDRRVEIIGSANPLEALADHLRNIDSEMDTAAQTWAPDRYRGSLIEAATYFEIGLLPDPEVAGSFPWPWPGVAPGDFGVPADANSSIPRRVMAPAEAAVHGFSDNGGVVKAVYLLGPDGVTVYHFSLWPLLPDETS